MDTFKIYCYFAFALVTVSCTDKKGLDETNAGWSKPSNALSAKLIFEVDISSSHAKVVHPKIKLRNESDNPIKFLWCVYDAGIFVVKSSKEITVQRSASIRSGPQGAKVIIINPGEIYELDAYDYGYGLSSDSHVFAFNTASFQAELKSGLYSVDYRLVVNQTDINRMLKDYDWIHEDPSSLWIGDIVLKNVQLHLK